MCEPGQDRQDMHTLRYAEIIGEQAPPPEVVLRIGLQPVEHGVATCPNCRSTLRCNRSPGTRTRAASALIAPPPEKHLRPPFLPQEENGGRKANVPITAGVPSARARPA
ncbi:hypothetical protein GCM10010244_62660 [Streptomyces coeruleorubidus]|nr:hypothetical protein GCM10010244_62660 [Streptomyces bellus]